MTVFYTFWEVHIPKNAYCTENDQEIFQRKIDQTYENCRGAVGRAGDMQVFGNGQTCCYTYINNGVH